MISFPGRRTRDIAISTETLMQAHAAQHSADIRALHQVIVDGRAEMQGQVERRHGENQQQLATLRGEVKALHGRLDQFVQHAHNQPWRLLGALAVMLTIFGAVSHFLGLH